LFKTDNIIKSSVKKIKISYSGGVGTPKPTLTPNGSFMALCNGKIVVPTRENKFEDTTDSSKIAELIQKINKLKVEYSRIRPREENKAELFLEEARKLAEEFLVIHWSEKKVETARILKEIVDEKAWRESRETQRRRLILGPFEITIR